jgi:hypothetical protein
MCGMERQEEIGDTDEGWMVRGGNKGVGGVEHVERGQRL